MKIWLAEFLGTALITLAVVGSAFMATNLSDDPLLQLLVNAIATVLTLTLVIAMFAPISGAHFNPIVTLILAFERKMKSSEILSYISAQIVGGIFGVALANLMFESKLIVISSKSRAFGTHYLGELIATSILILVIMLAIHQQRTGALHYLVPAWIGTAYFATVSTSFANPAVTISRIFTDNFSGINPTSALIFIGVQLVGGFLGLGIARALSKR